MQVAGRVAVLVCVVLGVVLFGCDGQTQTEEGAAQYRIAMDRAGAHLEAEEYQQAVEQYTAAIDIDPAAAAYVGRGNAYVDLAEYKAAVEDYDRALELDPGNAEVRRNRGLAYLGIGELRLAIGDFDAAIRQNIADVPARMARGIAVSQMELLGGAEVRLGDSVPMKDGETFVRIEMDDEAIRMLRRYRRPSR